MAEPSNHVEPFGRELRSWRRRRRLSQLDLSLEADVSARHLSFLETGRARPSREMVLRLGRVLDLPLRERNELLLLAGYAPVYGESRLDDPCLEPIREALEFLLARHEPYPAFLLDRRWDVRMSNRAHRRLLALFRQATGMPEEDPENALRLVLAPDRLRPAIVNWPQVARAVMARLDRQLRRTGPAADLVALRAELLEYPGVREATDLAEPPEREGGLLIPMVFTLAGETSSWYTTIASFGAPLDATVQEAVIESLLPADEATERLARDLAATDGGGGPGSPPSPTRG